MIFGVVIKVKYQVCNVKTYEIINEREDVEIKKRIQLFGIK